MKTLNHILCPVDFSEESMVALQNAAFLARLYKADLTLLHILTRLPKAFGAIYGIDLDAMLDEEQIRVNAQNLLEESWKKYIPFALTSHLKIRKGLVSEEIAQEAEEVKADLIIMASQPSSGIENYLVGSNTFRTVQLAPCPVMAIKGGKVEHGFEKVLIPVSTDFGIRELRRYHRHYFSFMDPKIKMITVLKKNASEAEMKHTKKYLDKEIAYFNKEGTTNVSYEILTTGKVPDTICDYAQAGGFDLIMMNSHGRKGLGRLVVGSVTSAVINMADIPVFTIRPGREERTTFAYHSWFPI